MGLRIKPLPAALGAEVEGVSLAAPLDAATAAALRRAWLDHLVLVFRGQRLDDDALMGFAAAFGDPERAPGADFLGPDRNPYIAMVSNVVVDGKPIGALGNADLSWHSDMSYLETPPTASILYAEAVPEAGGDTYFMNMYAALEALPAALRAEIDGLALNHDASTTSASTTRKGMDAVTDPSAAPGWRHAAVVVHPETGRKALFLGRRLNAYVIGRDLADSEALLDRIWAHLDDETLVYRHRWRVGDVVMWDNRCTMHRRDPFDAAARRIMHRAQIKGGSTVPARAGLSLGPWPQARAIDA